MTNVIVTGSLGYDYIMDFPGLFADRIMPDKIHKLSLSFLVNKLDKQFGGTAGNIGYNLNLLGINPLIYSAAGNDFSAYKSHLITHKITTDYIIEYENVTTGSYFVITDHEDNQIGAFYEGAMRNNKKLSIKDCIYSSIRQLTERSSHSQTDSSHLRSNNNKIDFVIVAPNDPKAMVKYTNECQKLHLPYLYDPAFQIDHFSRSELLNAIKHAAILIGNDYEIELIKKKTGLTQKQLLKLTPIVITTLGSLGSTVEYNPTPVSPAGRLPPLNLRGGGEGLLKIKPAKPDNISDPTGAGDAYRAGFLTGFLHGFDLKTCGQMGSVAAAYTVEKYGTQTHEFLQKDFELRYEKNFQEKLKFK